MNIDIMMGRFQPPHIGHFNSLEFLSEQAKSDDAIAYVALSSSVDNIKNPLTYEQRVKYMERPMNSINVIIWDKPINNVYTLLRDLLFHCEETGGGIVKLFCGSDRLDTYLKMAQNIEDKYHSRNECLGSHLEVVESMTRDSDKAYSSTQMRQLALDNDLKEFTKHCMDKALAKDMFDDVRKSLREPFKESSIYHSPEFVKDLTKQMAVKVNEHINQITNKPDKLYYVGGCLRDALLGKTPSDFDMVTTMYYKDFAELFDTEDCRWRGKRVIVVPVIEGEEMETACLSKGQVIEDRLVESDLTINGIGQDILTEEIIDPLHGQDDLNNQILRATPWAIEGFKRGGLNVALLRIFRFYSQLGWDIDYETMDAIEAYSQINNGKLIVSERQFEREWNKLIKGKYKDETLQLIKDFGFHNYFLKTQPLYRDYYEQRI